MPYFQLRIHLDPSSNRTLPVLLSLCSRIARKKEAYEYSFGYELLDRCGHPTRPHIHFHFVTPDIDLCDPLRAMKKFIHDQAFSGYQVKLKGPHTWCMQMVEEPKDHQAWLRYPLKECGSEFWKTIKGKPLFKSDEYTLEALADIAMALRREAVARNVIHLNKHIDKLSFYDRMKKHLDKLNSDPSSNLILPIQQRSTYRNIFKYYVDQKKSICFKTIDGYTILYLAEHGMITSNECYEKHSSLAPR